MPRTLVETRDGRILYEYPTAVDTNSRPLFIAQAELRWFEYHIPPEFCYGWFTGRKQLACIR